ncbi:hypothetical protein JTB14_014756 [Gonioctena quinquepunctata]|nr:hypothetical protein JTB14_014756 [Gonioctena quinquepunctata]
MSGQHVQHQRRNNDLWLESLIFIDETTFFQDGVSGWKELGGGSVLLKPDDGTNPVLFINKIPSSLREAVVPATEQLSLVVGALQGSAADWEKIKWHSCKNFGEFKTIFLDRYWNAHTQREA